MKFKVKGGIPLIGEVTVSGSKNAALPILFATLLVKGTVEIRNLPNIGDVRVALSILEGLGAAVFRSDGAVFINTDRASYKPPNEHLVSKIRASTYLIGACLARFGRCDLCRFGGCNFSDRPIDLHLFAASRLGAEVNSAEVRAKALVGSEISFSKVSVGATVNSLLMAQGAAGTTVIRGFAREPHILALIDFLRACGGDITVGKAEITVRQRPLHGTKARIIGDMIEAGTYAAAALITGGEVKISGVMTEELTPMLSAFDCSGVETDVARDSLWIKGRVNKPISVAAGPYPAFPTDLQPISAPLMATHGGRITDKVWCDRFGYLDALSLFGLRSLRIPGGAVLYPSAVKAARVTSPDLRGGAACLMLALCADGVSEIGSAELIMRGYEDIAHKLNTLGAAVTVEQ